MAKLKNLFTPTQVLVRHPEIGSIWNAAKIGYLFMLQLVGGKKMRRGCLVDEHDVIALYNWRFGLRGQSGG